ncbi:NB-ARC domain-containing protein [Kitasatospora sp. NPDC098663]|uniref:NB-ARC domain-containing protein n=1 Tax=Kitasatospora sp. NPDC098663 TaxID=3364096 RepID=UPI00380B8554
MTAPLPSVSNRITGTRSGPVVQTGQVRDVHFHPAAPPRPVPRQLTAVTRVFTDREHDEAALDGLLTGLPEGTAPVIVITGACGIGKRTLATRWGHRHTERYPDGQLLVRLRASSVGGPAPAAQIARSLLLGLGEGERGHLPWQDADLQALWRSIAATRRLLVTLEDATSADQVLPLVPATADCLVVVTSRAPMPALAAHGAHHHHLAPLTPAHAVRLLARILGEDRVSAEPGAAEALARTCGGNPLALGLAASEAVLAPTRPLVHHPALAATDVEIVPMTTALALTSLPEPEARLLRLAALVPAPDLDHLAVAAATATPAAQTLNLLHELAARQLLEHTGRQSVRGDVYRIRPEVRELIRSPTDTRQRVVQCYLDHLIATAQDTIQRLTPHHRVLPRQHRHHPAERFPITDDRTAQEWLEAITPAVLPALAAARELDENQAATVLVHDLWPLFHRLRRTDLSVPCHTLGLGFARLWGHRLAIYEMTTTLAISHKRTGAREEALRLYEEGRALATEDQDSSRIAQCTAGIGATLYDAGQYAAAEPELTRAITLYADLGDRRGAGLAEILLGSAAARQGNTDLGIPLLQQALADLESLTPPDPLNAARAKVFLGEAQSLAGQHDPANWTINIAVQEFAHLGHRHWTAHAIEYLGQAAERGGLPEVAASWYSASQDQYRNLGSSRDVERLHNRLLALLHQ